MSSRRVETKTLGSAFCARLLFFSPPNVPIKPTMSIDPESPLRDWNISAESSSSALLKNKDIEADP